MSMTSKPNVFSFYRYFYFAIAISFPVQIFFLMDYNLADFFYSFRHLTSLNYLIMAFLFVNGFAINKLHRSVIFTTPILLTLILINNIFVINYSSLSVASGLLSFAAFTLIHYSLYSERHFQVLVNPKKRWWLSSPRTRINTVVKIDGVEHKDFYTFDLSESGAFIPSKELTFNTKDYPIGSLVSFKILIEDKFVPVKAKIMRKTPTLGKYPTGIGVQFTQPIEQLGSFLAAA